MEDSEKSGLSLPNAIVIAGVLIALAIGGGFVYLKKSSGPTAGRPAANPEVRPVDKTDYVLGDRKASLQVITYTDLECPFCKVDNETLTAAAKEYAATGKVAFVYRDFPIASLHSQARQEAISAECAGKLGGDQKFYDFVNKVFAATPSNNGLDLSLLPKFATELGLDSAKFNDCVNDKNTGKKVDREAAEAMALGAQGTPFSAIVYKGKLQGFVPGALPFEDKTDQNGQKTTGLKSIIDQVLSGK